MIVCFVVSLGISAQKTTITVMSMNIKEGGLYAAFDTNAFVECIQKYNPDFVSFQEMDRFTNRNGQIDMLTEMAVKLGMFPYFGKAFSYSQGDYGNAILSKYPFHYAKNIVSKPEGAKENRTCTWIETILPNGQTIRIASTHLDVGSDDQIRISMVATINKNLLQDDEIPTLLIGDFNSQPTSDTMNYTKIKWQDIGLGTPNTIPSSGVATQRIDYVLGYPKKWLAKSYEVVCYPELSDHCFIVAELEVPLTAE